ncbi:helix-turn-helix transcriptional regulator [Mycolicibacter algericus]|uniref:Helix-turn-helix domain-containing protein n=2 Tax=Mycolicibacter algericus TaxID=1288388 RepID=A0A7I9Y7H1_MYCAL|nr:helix-turn-helix domain-containing protein [Mycolicibacter algericus]OQZ99075.1 DNA-binding protein [Mycolicibacter algericus DSM 45454]GFG84564.1 hypothetical protein MALGJ_12400 [Mycolicibacter algericus]
MTTTTAPAGDVWLTRQEVADRLKLPVRTIAMWAYRRIGPRYTVFGRHARYRLADVQAWEAEQAGGGTE